MQLLYLTALPEQRVARLILDGVRRYADSRRWDVVPLSWKEAKSLWGNRANRRRPVIWGEMRPFGFVVECGDMPCDLPVALFGNLPAVFVNCAASPRGRRFASIPVDNVAIARSAFVELSKCRPPAYAVVDLRHAKGHWPTLRVRAFKCAVAEAKAQCHAFLFKDPAREDVSGETERLSAWLASLPRRTAIFAVNDETSADVVEAARAIRLSIPQDLTLLGVDNNLAICEASKPTLSSIQVDFENAGFQAAKTLGKMIGDKVAIVHKSTIAKCSQIGNDKCGAPGGRALPVGAGRRAAQNLDLPFVVNGEHLSIVNIPTIPIGPLLAVRRESTHGFGRRNPNILQAVEMIRREACNGLTAKALISRFPGSRWLFEMRFREAMGHSVLDEIQHTQLEKVCTLLATTDTSIEAISDFCGFGSGRALRDCFRKRMGLSMREFRDRNRH